MFFPKTTKSTMWAVAGVAVLMALLRSCRPTGDHPYYFANRAATCRRLERLARQQAVAARVAAEDTRGKMVTSADRDRFKRQLERYEEDAATWRREADRLSRDAADALKSSRENGDIPSELPAHLRRDLKPEDLNP